MILFQELTRESVAYYAHRQWVQRNKWINRMGKSLCSWFAKADTWVTRLIQR